MTISELLGKEAVRSVYEMALTELARFLPRNGHHNRYLRAGMRSLRHDDESGPHHSDEGELPPLQEGHTPAAS